MKNQEEIENKDKIKEILGTKKVIKIQRQPHLLYIRKKHNVNSY